MARSDYAHWNEDQDRVWWEEEGRHVEEPEYDPDDYLVGEEDEPEEVTCFICKATMYDGDEYCFYEDAVVGKLKLPLQAWICSPACDTELQLRGRDVEQTVTVS